MNKIASRYWALSKNITEVAPNYLKRFIVSVDTESLMFDNVTPICTATTIAAKVSADFYYAAELPTGADTLNL